MASFWQFYVPSARTNLVANPSLETNTTGWVLSGAGTTISRSNDYAAFGGHSLKVITDSGVADQGAYYSTLALAALSTYTASAYVYAPLGAAYKLRAYDFTNTTTRADTTFTGTGAWQRVEVTFTTIAGAASYYLYIHMVGTRTETFYVDGAQVELQSGGVTTATTYIDGDRPGCQWNGAPNASTSTRSDQWRLGGTIKDFDDYGAYVTDHQGTGMANSTNVATDNGIIGGAAFQRSIPQSRPFSITVYFDASSQDDLHSKRQSLLDVLKPNLVSPQQPVVIRYTGNGNARIIHAHYEAGLESGTTWPNGADVPIRFIAHDPYWYEEHFQSKALPAFDTITDADYVLERAANGTWHALAGGLNGAVYAAVYASNGDLYVAGSFTTAYNAAGTGSAVTVNRVAMWNGSAWAALGSGFNNDVNSLALDAAGTLYAGGAFTDAAYPYLAKWNGSAWSAVGAAADGTGEVFTVRYNAFNGKVYVGGFFNNWGAINLADYIAGWNGTAWEAVGSVSLNNAVTTIAFDNAGHLVVGGSFTQVGPLATGRIARFYIDTSAWEAFTTGFNNEVYALLVDRAGRIYAGGTFTTPATMPYLAMYNGSSWEPVGNGVNGPVEAIQMSSDDQRRILIAGSFTAAGGSTLRDRSVVWNGSAWEPLPLDLPGSAAIHALAHNAYTNELAIGYSTSGSAVASNTVDTIINNPGTEDTAPVIFINHTGTVEAIINWTTGKGLYFNGLTIQNGEGVWLDLSVLTPQYMPTLARTPNERNGPRMYSSYRGDITRLIAPNSDLATWRLQPGSNTVLTKTKDAGAGSVFLMMFRSRYVSLDG